MSLFVSIVPYPAIILYIITNPNSVKAKTYKSSDSCREKFIPRKAAYTNGGIVEYHYFRKQGGICETVFIFIQLVYSK